MIWAVPLLWPQFPLLSSSQTLFYAQWLSSWFCLKPLTWLFPLLERLLLPHHTTDWLLIHPLGLSWLTISPTQTTPPGATLPKKPPRSSSASLIPLQHSLLWYSLVASFLYLLSFFFCLPTWECALPKERNFILFPMGHCLAWYNQSIYVLLDGWIKDQIIEFM